MRKVILGDRQSSASAEKALRSTPLPPAPPGGSGELYEQPARQSPRCVTRFARSASVPCVPDPVPCRPGADGSLPLPSAPPSPADDRTLSSRATRHALLEGLRVRIRAIERHPTGLAEAASGWEQPAASHSKTGPEAPRRYIDMPSGLYGAAAVGLPPRMLQQPQPTVSAPFSRPLRPARPAAWTLGEPAFDTILPDGGLDPAALHEIKPASHGDWPAAVVFAAALATRRLQDDEQSSRPILWCLPADFSREHGGLNGQGLAHLGLLPGRLVIVEARRPADVLWSLEEGIRSGSLAMAVGLLREVDLTASRRLGLAAGRACTPALLVTHPASAPTPSATLRLRVSRLPGGPHPFDSRAPGAPRFGLAIERCRGGNGRHEDFSVELEWCDVAHRFHLAAGLAGRAHATSIPRQRTG
jgi:protein ImuA